MYTKSMNYNKFTKKIKRKYATFKYNCQLR